MNDDNWLAGRFEAHRQHLRSVAFQMLGSAAEAEDAVQEAWFRLSRADASTIENLGGWLTTVVARVALDMLRSSKSRTVDHREDDVDLNAVVAQGETPEDQALLADSVGAALLVVLDTLAPAERLAFVLHDSFGVPFDEIGPILDRSPDAAKQLAHRARRKVRGIDPVADPDRSRQAMVIDAFLAASRNGDFEALVALLHPDIVLRADHTAVRMGSPETIVGATSVAGTFSGRAHGATAVLVDGMPGVVWAVNGRPKVVWNFTVDHGQVTSIEMIADPKHLASLELTELPDPS